MTIRLAMWSGPRNISTALMRSWENRPDCSVVDEPFYAYYLAQTNSPHPGFEQVLASQSQYYEDVAKQLASDACDTPLQYQKHMTQHMLTDDLSWAEGFKHCFLIRDPAEVVMSYTKSRGECSAEDIGIIRQAELYQQLTELSGQEIPVIDSNDVLKAPKAMLRRLCDLLELPFYTEMLSWPAGKRDSDGVWAEHWYHSVENSTGFSPYKAKELTLTSAQQQVVDQVKPAFEFLAGKRILL